MTGKPDARQFQWSRVTFPSGLSDQKQLQLIEDKYGKKNRPELSLEQKEKLYGGAPWQPGYEDNVVTMDLGRYGFGKDVQTVEVHRLLAPVLETVFAEVSVFCRETNYFIYSMGSRQFRYAKDDSTNYIRDTADLRRNAMAWWLSLPKDRPPRTRIVEPDWNEHYMIVAAYYERDVKHQLRPGALSNHAWGSALDINAHTNQLHSLDFDMPAGIVAIMRNHGFHWGGYYNGHGIDPMHFEYLLDTIVESRRVVFPLSTPKVAPHAPGYYALNECGEGGGYYPVTLSKCLHGGAHFEAPGARTPVTALLPGYVVAARFIAPGTAGDSPVLREFLDQRLPSFVLLRHELTDPKAAGDPIVLYSLYMHLEPPDWNAPASDPATGGTATAKGVKKATNVPDSPAEASWVQNFLRLRHGGVVNLDPSLDGGTALGKTYWSAVALSGAETDFTVIGRAPLPAGTDAKPKALAKPAPLPVTKAIQAFKKGSVATFSKPVLQVGMGEVLGFVGGVARSGSGGAATRRDLHFELFSPAGPNGSPSADGIAALVKKLAKIQPLIKLVKEPPGSGNTSENNYLEIVEGGPNESLAILVQTASNKPETGMPPEGASGHPPKVNTTDRQELEKIFSQPDYEEPLKRFMQTSTFALPNGATNNDLRPKTGAPSSSTTEPSYWLKLQLENPHGFAGRADGNPISVRVTFFCGTEKLEGILEIADTNRKDYTILVPARADRMMLESDDVVLQELTLQNPFDAQVELFKALVPLHWRFLQVTHANEWMADSLERLLTELNQKEPTRIGHLLKMLEQEGKPHDLPALQRELRPLSWWNRQCTADDPFGEVPVIGGDPTKDSLFGSNQTLQLPQTGLIENVHPITGAWICDLAAQQNILTARTKWDITSLEPAQTSTTPVFLSFVGVGDDVAVGQKVPAVLVLEGYGSYEKGGSLTLTGKDASAPPPIVFDELLIIEGTATIAPRFSMWGTWELSAKDPARSALSPRKTPCLSLSARKPSPAGKLRIVRSPVDDSFWAWAPFQDKAPLALEGFLSLQYVKTSGGEPAADATWDYAQVAVPLVGLRGEEATTILGGVTIENGFAVRAEKNARVGKNYALADFAKKAKVKDGFRVSHALCLRVDEFRTLLALPLSIKSVSSDGLEVVAGLDKLTDANKRKLKEKADSSEFPPLASITHAVDDKGRITFKQATAGLQELFLEFRPRFAIGQLMSSLSLQPSDELYVRPYFLALNGGHHGVDLTPLSPPDGPAIAFDRDALLSRCNQDFIEVSGTLVFGPLKATGVEEIAFKMSDTGVRVEARLAGDLKQWEKSRPSIKLEVTGNATRLDGSLKKGVLSADWRIAPGGSNDPGRWGKQLNFSVVLGNPAAFQTPPQLLRAAFAAVPKLDAFEVKRGEGKRLELKGKSHCVPPTKDLIIRCDKWVDGKWVPAPEVEASIKYQIPAGKRPGGLCDENGDFLALVPEGSLDIPFDDTQRSWRFTWRRELTDGKIFGTAVAEKVFPSAFAGEASSGAGASHLAADDETEIVPHDIPPGVSYKRWATATAS